MSQSLLPGPSPRTLSLFFEQLHRMSAAGVSPVQTLETLRRGGMNRRLSAIAARMMQVIRSGGTWAEAFGEFPSVFAPLVLHLIAAAEQSGRLDAAFASLSRLYEQRHRRRQKLLTAVAYPLVVLHLAVLLPPLVKLVMESPGAYARAVLPGLGAAYGAVVALVVLWKLLRERLSPVTHRVLLALPIFGRITRRLSLARFASACRGLYEAGVSIPTCVEQAARASGNRHIEDRLMRAAETLREGTASASEALAQARVFPADALTVLVTGEQAGSFGEGLGKIAEYYEFEAEASIDRVLKVLPVLVLLGVGAYVGYLYISTMTRSLRQAFEMLP